MSQAAGGAVSPGGPRISSAKKRRLAALEQNLGGAGGSSANQPARGATPRGGSSSSQRQASNGGGGQQRSGGRGGGGGGREQQRQQQPPEPIYSRLDEGIAAGPAADALQLPRPEANSQVVSALLEQLMATNPRAFDARAAIGLKVQDRTVMLDNPVGQRSAAAAAAAQQQQQRGRGAARLAARLAGRSTQRRLGLYQLQGLTYEQVQPLHLSWRRYMQELLAAPSSGGSSGGRGGAPASNDLEARLYAADLHGCLIRVAHTADPQYRRVRGVVVRDTANTLHLVTPDSRLLLVPKALCTWEFDADSRRVVTLLGPGLVQRGASGSAAGGQRPRTLRDALRGQQRGGG